VKPRHWTRIIEDIDIPPMMSLNICHKQFDFFAKVSSLSQSGTTIKVIHITDLVQLEWAEKAFKVWQRDADFRQVAIPKKLTGEISYHSLISDFC
jgi:hypothetical protein